MYWTEFTKACKHECSNLYTVSASHQAVQHKSTVIYTSHSASHLLVNIILRKLCPINSWENSCLFQRQAVVGAKPVACFRLALVRQNMIKSMWKGWKVAGLRFGPTALHKWQKHLKQALTDAFRKMLIPGTINREIKAWVIRKKRLLLIEIFCWAIQIGYVPSL